MSGVMTWNWYGNSSGMPLGRDGNNVKIVFAINPTVILAPDDATPPPVDVAPDADPD